MIIKNTEQAIRKIIRAEKLTVVMKKTLVLAVDRDDDFGTKAGVSTPVVGIEDVTDAALKLGSIDPEDSDVNTVFAAIRIRNELFEEGKDVDVALICGDPKVGHVSDAAVVDELEEVLENVKPDRVILVSDGAEDEYVYPIISSRVPIDSVRKVFVKQTPGLESSIYILSRMLRDDDKRRRFLAPMGWALIIISMVFIIPKFLQFFASGDYTVFYTMSGSLLVLVIGLMLCSIAYNMTDRLKDQYKVVLEEVKSGNMSIVFSLLALALIICGIAVGLLSVLNMYESSITYKFLTFLSNVLWLAVFAVICNGVGTFIDNYMKTRTFNRTFMIGSITALSLAFVIQAIIDVLCSTLGYNYSGESIIVYELLVGICFGMCAAVLQMSFKEYYEAEDAKKEEMDPNAVQ